MRKPYSQNRPRSSFRRNRNSQSKRPYASRPHTQLAKSGTFGQPRQSWKSCQAGFSHAGWQKYRIAMENEALGCARPDPWKGIERASRTAELEKDEVGHRPRSGSTVPGNATRSVGVKSQNPQAGTGVTSPTYGRLQGRTPWARGGTAQRRRARSCPRPYRAIIATYLLRPTPRLGTRGKSALSLTPTQRPTR